MSDDNLGMGILCGVTSFIAAIMWLFNQGNQPLGVFSFWWAAPLVCPLAFLVYRKSKRGGLAAQALLYVLSIAGADTFMRTGCVADCDTKLQALANAPFAGYHIMMMPIILVWMTVGAWKAAKKAKSEANHP